MLGVREGQRYMQRRGDAIVLCEGAQANVAAIAGSNGGAHVIGHRSSKVCLLLYQ